MRRELFKVCFGILIAILSISSRAHGLDAIVYIISGGPMNLGSSEDGPYSQFLNLLDGMVPEADLYLQTNHNSEQKKICADILQKKAAHTEARVIVAGHSYGGDASVWVSKCLEKKFVEVDLLLTMDSVSRNAFSSKGTLTIPENVKLNFHFYQQHDFLIQGSGYNQRADKTLRGIYNVKQNFGVAPVASHLAVLKKLNEYGVSPFIAAGVIHGMTEAELAVATEQQSQKFLEEFPPETINYGK